MGINVPIVVYTHTDMVDTWEMFFEQLKKYLPNNKIYVAINEEHDYLSNYTQITYDDNSKYSIRWLEVLSKLDVETFLFLHEDMILFDDVKFDYIQKYYDLVNNDMVTSIKLIYTTSYELPSEIDNTLVKAVFSIQPTLINRKYFVSLCKSVGAVNIWEFEAAVQPSETDYMVKLGNETLRGEFHCDSSVFPYIATAINKGKWNMSEYKEELDKLFGKYNINPFDRGIV